MARQTLAGVRVVDMTEGVAGPYAATLLGDMGADVVKVERREGDWQRSAGRGEPGRRGNAQFIALNRNKRDIGVDLDTDAGRQVVERLVRGADVLISNYRPGVMDRLGFGYPRCRELRPDLIYCTVSGYGQDGTAATRPASDTILQAVSGVMSTVGEPDGPPLRVGFPLVDITAAGSAVQAVLLALYGRLKDEGGTCIDVSLMAAAASLLAGGYTDCLTSGRSPTRQGNQNSLHAPAGTFETADGRYLSLAVLRDSHWRRLIRVLDLEALAADPRFASNAARVHHRDELNAVIGPKLKAGRCDAWLERLRAAGILCGPVNTVADTLSDPELRAVLPLLDTGLAEAPLTLGGPIRRDGCFLPLRLPAPTRGEHTRTILIELEYTPAEIDGLLASGAAFVDT